MTEPTQPPASDDPARRPEPAAADRLSADAGIAPEVSRRVSSILDAVEREASTLRSEAVEEARRYLDYSRQRADALVGERQRRISELSDEIIAKAESVVGRLDDAAPVRAGFENLVRALGDAAERLAREAEEGAAEYEPPSFHDEGVQSYRPQPQAEDAGYGPGYPGEEETYQRYEPQQPAPPVQGPQQPAPQAPPQPDTYYAPPPSHDPGAATSRAPEPPPFPTHAAEQPSPAPHQPQQPSYPPAQQQPIGEDWQGIDDARLVGIQMAAAGRTRGQVREHLQNQMGVGETRSILDEIFGAGAPEDARVPWTAFPR